MATGKVTREKEFRSPELVTFPFTPTSSGILAFNINPSSSSGGYIILNDGNAFVFSAYGAGGTSGMLPCVKGRTVSQTSISGVTVSYRFYKLD